MVFESICEQASTAFISFVSTNIAKVPLQKSTVPLLKTKHVSLRLVKMDEHEYK